MKKLKTFIAIILAILTIILMFGFTNCYTIKHYINSDVIKKTITDNDFSDVINDALNENTEIMDNTKKVFEALNIPDDAVTQVINSPATKNFIGVYLASSVDAVLGSEEEKNITKDDLKSLIKDNLDIIQKEMPNEEKEFLESYENTAYDYIDEHGEEIISYFPTPKEIVSKINQDEIKINDNLSLKDAIKYLNFITDTKLLIIIGIAIGVSLLLIYLLKRKVRWAKYYIFISTFYAVFMGVVLGLLNIIKGSLANELKEVAFIVNYFIDGLNTTLWIFVIPSIIVAIICLIFYHKKKGLIKNEKVFE